MPSFPVSVLRHRSAQALLAAAAGLCALGLATGAQAKGGVSGGGAGQAAAPAVPGEILVVARSADAVTPLLSRHGLSITGRFGNRPIFRLKLVNGGDAAAVAAAVQGEPDILTAEPNRLHGAPESVRNNVWAVGTAGAYAVQWAGPALGLAGAQALATGAGVRVAVLDTGVDLGHPALAGRWLPGWDFVDGDADPSDTAAPTQAGRGHGTHVAGLVAWAAPGARLMPLRVLDNEGQGNAWVLAEALLHALDPDRNPATPDGAQVITLSMAGRERTRLMATIATLAHCGPVDPALAAEVDLSDAGYNDDRARCATQPGAVVVVAAGNDGSSSLKTYPAAEGAYSLLSVAASGADGRLAKFSNSGNWISLVAPGDGLTSTVPGGGYGTWSGTSMAAPLVAASAALVSERFPALPARDVARCLVASATPLNGSKLTQVSPGRALSLLLTSPRTCR